LRAAPGEKFGSAVVKFSDGGKQKFSLLIPSASDYTQVTDSQPLTLPSSASITKVKVSFQYSDTSGKYLLDTVSFLVSDEPLTPTPSSEATATANATGTPGSETATPFSTSTPTTTSTPTWTPTITPTILPVMQRLVASDGEDFDYFGSAVALDGKTLMVGAPRIGSDNPGAVYVFTFNGSTWVETQKLMPLNGENFNDIGYAIAISGDLALIGAPGETIEGDINRGAVYFFKFNGVNWVEQATLLASSGTASDQFGGSITISGNTAVIGAGDSPWTDDSFPGTAYIFTYDGVQWIQQAQLMGDNDGEDNFGSVTAFDGEKILIGSPYAYANAMSDGTAYSYTYDGLTPIFEQKFTISDSEDYDKFGSAVALSGDTAVISAPRYFMGGIAYVYDWNGTAWTQQAELTAADGELSNDFGNAVAIQDNRIYIGATYSGNDYAGAVFVFIFDGTSWQQQAKLTGFEGDFDGFGYALAVEAGTLVVGAPYTTVGTNEYQGAVYVMPVP
jgi:hypothetical protein